MSFEGSEEAVYQVYDYVSDAESAAPGNLVNFVMSHEFCTCTDIFCFTVPDLVPAPVFGHVGLAALEAYPGEDQGPAIDIEVLVGQAPLPLPGIFLFT